MDKTVHTVLSKCWAEPTTF